MSAKLHFLLSATALAVFTLLLNQSKAATALDKADPAPDNPKNCFHADTKGSIAQEGEVPGTGCSAKTCVAIGDELYWTHKTCGKIGIDLPKGCEFVAENTTGLYPSCCPSKLKC